MQPKFISIEGGEGVGKTTNLKLLESILDSHNIRYILTREPGGTTLAEEIREILLKNREEQVDPVAELLLVFAARAQHVAQRIKPALEEGYWVICDRFTDATFAYQGGGRELDWSLIEQLEQMTLQGFNPDKTLLLDVEPEIGMKRAARRSDFDRFENEHMAFFNRVRAAYHKRLNQNKQRFILVDAGESLTRVQDNIRTQFERYILEVSHE